MSPDSRMATALSFEFPQDCGNVSYSCLTNAQFMLATLTMVFGIYSWYLLMSVSLCGIFVRAVSTRCFTTYHAMGTVVAAWVEVQ